MSAPAPNDGEVLVRAQPLADLIAEMIAAAGSSPAESREVADNLVLANLSGHDSHGVGMVPRYVAAVAEGGLVPGAEVQVLLDSGALLRLDGRLGYGQSVGAQAMRMGIERARRHGVCIVALNRGEPLAPGCLLDDAGHPTTDARHAVIEPTGALLPFGEHKGSGLALICELLGGALTGGDTWRGPADGRRQVVNGMLSILIDPAALGTAAHLADEIEAFVAWVKDSPAVDGVDRVRVAGDAERETIARRRRDGIPIDASTWAELVAAGERCGLAAQRFAQAR